MFVNQKNLKKKLQFLTVVALLSSQLSFLPTFADTKPLILKSQKKKPMKTVGVDRRNGIIKGAFSGCALGLLINPYNIINFVFAGASLGAILGPLTRRSKRFIERQNQNRRENNLPEIDTSLPQDGEGSLAAKGAEVGYTSETAPLLSYYASGAFLLATDIATSGWLSSVGVIASTAVSMFPFFFLYTKGYKSVLGCVLGAIEQKIRKEPLKEGQKSATEDFLIGARKGQLIFCGVSTVGLGALNLLKPGLILGIASIPFVFIAGAIGGLVGGIIKLTKNLFFTPRESRPHLGDIALKSV